MFRPSFLLLFLATACASMTAPPAVPQKAAPDDSRIASTYVVLFPTADTAKQFSAQFSALIPFGYIPFSGPSILPSKGNRFVLLRSRRVGLLWDPSEQELAVLKQLGATVEEDSVVTLMKTPSDGDFGEQCGLKRIGAEAAWDYAPPDSARVSHIHVSIIDSGVDTHRDLPTLKTYNPDVNGHGTHVAGIIGAAEGNGGIVGVVWNAELYGYGFTDAQGQGELGKAVDELTYTLDHDAPNIVVMAWVTTKRDILEKLILDPLYNKVLFVAAAGNSRSNLDRTPVYPAAIKAPNLISVMASGCDDSLPVFTSFGQTTVDIAAPGAGAIGGPACTTSCDVAAPGILSTVRNNYYCCMQGTSMSAALVAGAAALVRSQMADLDPDGAKVKQCLVDSVSHIQAFSTKCKSGGRLNLRRAVDTAESLPSCR